MSGLLAGKVWQSNLSSHLKPLAAAMADIANDDGSRVFPSVAYLAWLLGKGDRSVQNGLAELKSLGIIEAVAYEKGGRNHPTEYHLIESNLPYRAPWKDVRKGATSAPFAEIKGAVSDNKGCSFEQERVQLSTERVQPVAPDPLVEPSVTVKEPSAPFSGESFTEAFVAFEAHRKEIRKPLKPTGRKALFAQLKKMGETQATTALWRSIEHGWVGVFPPRENDTNGGPKILEDHGDWYTVMGADGTPSKRWRTDEAFAAYRGITVEEVRHGIKR